MPPNTVKVDRTTRWGNPFNFKDSSFCWVALTFGCRGDPAGRHEASVKAFRQWIDPGEGRLTLSYEQGLSLGDVQLGARAEAGLAPTIDEIRAELAGKNLACWCKPGQPCHADVLLELANAPESEP